MREITSRDKILIVSSRKDGTSETMKGDIGVFGVLGVSRRR
jgi:hypothetical protein